MNVITITRQVGSWGDYIGVDVANTLKMRYIDRDDREDRAELLIVDNRR